MITAILGGLKVFAGRLLVSLCTEKFVAWLAFYFLDKLVASTENEVDDEVVSEVKKAYYGK